MKSLDYCEFIHFLDLYFLWLQIIYRERLLVVGIKWDKPGICAKEQSWWKIPDPWLAPILWHHQAKSKKKKIK